MPATTITDPEKFRAELQAAWNSDPKHQAEFLSFDAFHAYTRALVEGRISRVRAMGRAVQGADT